MASENQNMSLKWNTTRRNLVIQGLQGQTDDEIMSNVIKVATTIGIIMYKEDIEAVLRLKNRDETLGPVVVTLKRISQRNKFFQKKINLLNIESMANIFVNADESIDVWRNKAILRRVAYKAKEMGASILFQHDRISIDDILYTLDDIHKIPEKYKPNLNRAERRPRFDDEQGATGVTYAMETTPTEARKNPTISDEQIRDKRRLFRPNEKIRVTKSVVVFSGPTAYISNMHRVPVTYKTKDYKSNEHAIQCTKAEEHNKPELAEKLKEVICSYEVKRQADENITSTEEWNAKAPNVIEELFMQKMEQHPELKSRLISTYPLPLVEGSSSMKWGGGIPFESILYDTAEYPGNNKFGKSATNYRDKLYHKMSNL